MDLIYANSQHEDLGVLQGFTWDLAFGSDENNFEIVVYEKNHVCDQDYIVYVEGSEYGGIIDRIEHDTDSKEIRYSGRTWQGVINSRVVAPPSGADYFYIEGEGNEVLKAIIDQAGLSKLVEVSTEDSDIQVALTSVRYDNAYDLINKVATDNGGKIAISYSNGKINLQMNVAIDYTMDEEFDNTQVGFAVGRTFNNYNHMVCLGQGDLKDRAVIHLFTDDNDEVQVFTISESPLSDEDYILDERNKVKTGLEERTYIYDNASAEITYNYVALTDKPSRWAEIYTDYYSRTSSNGTVTYKNLEKTYADEYRLQASCPRDWNSKYKNYYIVQNGSPKSVAAVSEVSVTALTSKPSDWNKNYSAYVNVSDKSKVTAVSVDEYNAISKTPKNWKKTYSKYYYKHDDGTTIEYKTIPGVSYDKYVLTTRRPSDWGTTWENYYARASTVKKKVTTKTKTGKTKTETVEGLVFNKKGKWHTLKEIVDGDLSGKPRTYLLNEGAVQWKKKSFYKKETLQKAPKYSSILSQYGIVYEKNTIQQAPAWKSGSYGIAKINTIPKWQKGKYYTKYPDVEQIPEFTAGTYYKQYVDRYAVLVKEAITKLEELCDTNTLDINLELENSYDVGDIVGVIDNITGITIKKSIIKKIVKFDYDGIMTVEYEV